MVRLGDGRGVDVAVGVPVGVPVGGVTCEEAGGVAEGIGCASIAVTVASLAFRLSSSSSSSDRTSMRMDMLILGFK